MAYFHINTRVPNSCLWANIRHRLNNTGGTRSDTPAQSSAIQNRVLRELARRLRSGCPEASTHAQVLRPA